MSLRGLRGIWLAWLVLLCVPAPAAAQELLQNRSFETPVAPANGNNFYTTIASWTVTGTQAQPVNIVKPWSGYSGNPTVTPTGGGVQYLDVNSSDGKARQTVTIPPAGMIDFSAWFSVRDFSQALTGCTVNIYNASNVLVGSVSTSFAASDPIGLWKQAASASLPVAAGTYTIELVIPDYANVDLASLVFKPALTMAKTSKPYSDPVNGTTNPKLIPGGLAEYTITVTSPSSYTVSANSLLLVDATPAGMDLSVLDIAGTGTGPAALAQGSPSSTLTYTYGGLSSTTDNIQFSNNGGTTWTYTPVANANGVDPNVTHVRLNPQGTMAAGSSFNFRLRYRIR